MIQKSMKDWEPFVIAGAVGLIYFISNLLFFYSLDDSVNYINAIKGVNGQGWPGVFSIIHNSFKPPPLDNFGLYRPLRTTYTFILFAIGKIQPVLPDLINAVTAALCALILVKIGKILCFPKKVIFISVIWFFCTIPVIAMGQVVLVSQFLVVSAIYASLYFVEKSMVDKEIRWLGVTCVIFLIASYYAEAMIIPAGALAIQSVLLIVINKKYRIGMLFFISALVMICIVLGIGFISTGDIQQLGRTLNSILMTRGYDSSTATDYSNFIQIIMMKIRSYPQIFRYQIFTGLMFSISPYLFILLWLSLLVKIGVEQKKIWVAILFTVVSLVLAYINFILVIAVLLAMMVIFQVRHCPILASIVVSGLIILGPTFVIDTHISYILPAMLFLMFQTINQSWEIIKKTNFYYVYASLLCVLPLIFCTNLIAGVYFSKEISNDNQLQAGKFKKILDNGVVLTNFRHIFDMYLHVNKDRSYKDYKEKVYFTATVPLYDDRRKIDTPEELVQWVKENRLNGKKSYMYVVDSNRLPGKVEFHSPKFLEVPDCELHFLGSHVFERKMPIIDPGFFFTDYFYRNGLTIGMIGYPIFPDMIDDVSVEYGGIWKRLFAVYRLFEVKTVCTDGFKQQTDFSKRHSIYVRKYHGNTISLGADGLYSVGFDKVNDPHRDRLYLHYDKLIKDIHLFENGISVPSPIYTASSQFKSFGPDGLWSASQPGWHSQSPAKYPEVITVDFGCEKEKKSVLMLPQDGQTARFPKKFKVEKSFDKKSWRQVSVLSDKYELIKSGDWHIINFTNPNPARYFRIVVLSNYGDPNYVSLRGLKFE